MKAKRFLFSFIAICILLFVLILPSYAANSGVVSDKYATMTMRDGPGTSHNKIVEVPAGTTVTIIETVNCDDGTTSKQWYHITCDVNGVNYNGYGSTGLIIENIDTQIRNDAPEVYASYISKLKSVHPKWQFVFLHTGLDWNDVVAAETQPKVSMVYGSRPISYRSTSYNFTNNITTYTGYVAGQYLQVEGDKGTVITQNNPLKMRSGPGTSYSEVCSLPKGTVVQFEGIYPPNDGTTGASNWCKVTYTVSNGSGYIYTPTEGTNWYQAHGQVVQYYLDPRNFLNEKNVFMFEQLSYNANFQNIDGVSAILSTTSWGKGNLTTTDGRTISFAQAFYEAGQRYNVSPYHLVSRAVQEVGRSGTNAAYGNNPSYPSIFNFYSIGANTGMLDGLNWASQSGTYGRPWNTPYKSIVGGAEYIASGYISKGQSTLYLQKFDLIASGGYYNHQYMSNIEAAASESVNMYNSYANVGALDSQFVFVIPVYNNLPHLPCSLPEASSSPNMAKDTDLVNKGLYVDVYGDEWYYNAVKYCTDKGYFSGYSNGYFGPADGIQRQDFVLVLSKIANVDLSEYSNQQIKFADVGKNEYYSAAIAWAYDAGLISGYENGRFGVGDQITREQACLILYKYFGIYKNQDVSTSASAEELLQKYSDKSNVSDWATQAVAWSIDNKVISGTTSTTISPYYSARRAEIAQIIINMSNNNMI